MHRRLWLSVAMLAAGASLLVAASLASAAGNHASAIVKKGGVWKTYYTGEETSSDPQITYDTLSWEWEYATAAKLLNWPDKAGAAGSRIVPEVASRYTVSKNGKVYTFYLRKNFKFSNGKQVTAKNFVFAIHRTLSKAIQSPGQSFIKDPASTFIKSYKAKGKWKLVIKLKRPSGVFPAELTMPFFQATPLNIPANKPLGNVTSASQLPAAGPYHVVYSNVSRLTSIRRNTHYKVGAAGHHRPVNLNGWQVEYNVNAETGYLETLKGQFDEGAPTPDKTAATAHKYGVNKSRFWVKPNVCTGYIPLNTQAPAFSSNTPLRHAMNFGLNRRAYAAAPGPFAEAPFTHILPPGMPGTSSGFHPYPTTAKYATARKLAKGHYKNHKLNIWYRSSGITGPKQKLLIDRDLRFLGYSESQLNFRGYNGLDIYDAVGASGNKHSFDMALSVGWCQDYPDPYDFMNKLLTAGGISKANGDNWAFFNNKKWTTKMNAAARLTGAKRIKAYRSLDKAITTGPAPWAAMITYSNVYLLSSHVNTKCLVYQGVYTAWDIATSCKK